jgi:hypothetical protein
MQTYVASTCCSGDTISTTFFNEDRTNYAWPLSGVRPLHQLRPWNQSEAKLQHYWQMFKLSIDATIELALDTVRNFGVSTICQQPVRSSRLAVTSRRARSRYVESRCGRPRQRRPERRRRKPSGSADQTAVRRHRPVAGRAVATVGSQTLLILKEKKLGTKRPGKKFPAFFISFRHCEEAPSFFWADEAIHLKRWIASLRSQ